MKIYLQYVVLFLLLIEGSLKAQIITPVIKANFGVEAELRANYFNGSISSGNDDWFNNGTPGTGTFIIDTTGAAAIRSQYILNPSLRKSSFVRNMNYPMYSVVNGKLLYDALYIRDHHKNDSTAFAGSNKNAQSPASWNGQTIPVPDKNDINDVMLHVRRDGPNLSDSLWFFGGISLVGNTGNRYFDFELYQSDIYLNKADGKFYNYGAEAGHTAWQFDAAGNITKPGDIIFTAEFGSSSLTTLEARIWVHQSSLSLTPAQFNWGGSFDKDGAGSSYGYANILPKTGGNFYSGMQCADSTWGGPFGFINVNDVLSTYYDKRNYMEIAVNMTKIGLDPYTILGGGGCSLSFRRVFAKTRTSTSFTSELKDFVGPYKIALPPSAVVAGDLSMFCGTGPGSGYSQLSVQNPLSTSIYNWTTDDGHFSSSPNGPSVTVDMPGTYVVTQTLYSGCSTYSTDTITLVRDNDRCQILASENIYFTGKINNSITLLKWESTDKEVTNFYIERSKGGRNFENITSLNAVISNREKQTYQVSDEISHLNSELIYYRLKSVTKNSKIYYSKTISIKNSKAVLHDFLMKPNPAKDFLQINFNQSRNQEIMLQITNIMGYTVYKTILRNLSDIIDLKNLPAGIYSVNAFTKDGFLLAQKKLMLSR